MSSSRRVLGVAAKVEAVAKNQTHSSPFQCALARCRFLLVLRISPLSQQSSRRGGAETRAGKVWGEGSKVNDGGATLLNDLAISVSARHKEEAIVDSFFRVLLHELMNSGKQEIVFRTRRPRWLACTTSPLNLCESLPLRGSDCLGGFGFGEGPRTC